MSIIKKSLKMFVVAAIAGLSIINNVQANGWDWSGPYKSKQSQVETLVIADDEGASRVLADLILAESKQPYLKLPGKASKLIAFVGAKQSKGIEIPEKDFKRFIEFLSPKRILVIAATGEKRDKFVGMLPENKTVVIIYNNENWLKTAKTISVLFNMSYLANDFERLYTKAYINSPYRPTKAKKKEVKIGSKAITTSSKKITPKAAPKKESAPVNKPVSTKDKLEKGYVIEK